MDLKDKILNKEATICIIGLGYVGLPHAVAFATSGFRVIGLDLSQRRVAAVNRGHSDIPDVPSEQLAALVDAGRLEATTDYDRLADADVVLICVPTPFDDMKTPDLQYIISAAEGIMPRMSAGKMVILQSTTYPGTTEEIVQPILERSSLLAGRDFHLVFSPERIDPGNAQYSAHNIPKVVGGLTPACTELACSLFGHLTPAVNELAVLMERMGIDIWEVIGAAKTKPFGFMAFSPGPGVGGHCIPVDPYYLSWKAREFDFYTKFIELAAEVNADMPNHVVSKIAAGLNLHGQALRGAHVLVLGVAFKRDIDDARNSPAQRVIELLLDAGATVEYYDPYVPVFHVGGNALHRARVALHSVTLGDALASADVVAIITGHTNVDYAEVVARSRIVVDAVNATSTLSEETHRIIRLGAPMPAV